MKEVSRLPASQAILFESYKQMTRIILISTNILIFIAVSVPSESATMVENAHEENPGAEQRRSF
jgi:hypothetical protein